MIVIEKVLRNPKGKEWEDTITVIAGNYDLTKTVGAFMEDVTPGRVAYKHDGFVIRTQEQQYDAAWNEVETGGITYLKITLREVPYVIGQFRITLIQDGTESLPYAELYEPEQRDNDGVRMSTTVTINNNKNKLPVTYANQIMGVPHTYRSMYDFFYMPREHMVPGMASSVIFPDGIRTYNLMIEGDPMDMPWPLRDLPRGIAGSFRNYWELTAVSRPEGSATSEKKYAPNFKGGIPPYFDGYVEGALDMEGYVFPPGPEYDEVRNWTNDPANWTAQKKEGDQWYKYREPAVILQDAEGNARKIRKYSRPMRIGGVGGTNLQNRFLRVFKPTSTPAVTYNGKSNTFALVEHFGVEYAYFDVQPKRRVWADLRAEEQAAYEAEYGAVLDTADPTLIKRINRLWMVVGPKDEFNKLQGSWEGPTEIADGDGDRVRYSASNNVDINELRVKQAADQDPNIYESNGWKAEYKHGVHRFMAYRTLLGDPWIVIQTTGELGNFHKNVFKQYPINYFDRITNTGTALGYVPVGKDADVNPEDDYEGPWLDTPPVGDLKPGHDIYISLAVLTKDGQAIENWSPLSLWSTRIPVIDSLSSSAAGFIRKVEDTDDSQAAIVERSPEHIDLKGTLHQDGIELQSKTAEAGYDANAKDFEKIRYKWYIVYNGGTAYGPLDSLGNQVLDDGRRPIGKLLYDSTDPLNTVELDALGASIQESGRVLRIVHGTVEAQATFKCIQERNVEGNKVFQDVGMAWIPYISFVSITDYVDKVIRGISVSTDANQFLVKDTPRTLLVKADYIGHNNINLKAHLQNVDLGTGSWYRWKMETYDFNTTRDNTLATATGKEDWDAIMRTAGGTYWETLNDPDLEHRVLWNSHNFHDKSMPNYHVFKYQVNTEKGHQLYDEVTLTRVLGGANARDMRLSPENFVVSINDAGTALEAGKATSKEFSVTTQGVENPTFTWKLKNGDNTLRHTATGPSYLFEADSAKVGSQFTSFADLDASFPLYLEAHCDQHAGLVEDAIIQVLRGGSFGIKGDVGSDGISVIYDRTDLVPTTADGAPLGTVNEEMEVLIFDGKVKQAGGADVGQFQLVDIMVTAGTTYTVVNGLTINTTGIPKEAPEVVFDFYIKKNTGVTGTDSEEGYVVDQAGIKVKFTYKIKKARAGADAVNYILENTSSVQTKDAAGNVITKVTSMSVGGATLPVLHESFAYVFESGAAVPVVANTHLKVLMGEALIPATGVSATGYTVYAPAADQVVTATQRNLYVLLSNTDGRVRIVLKTQAAGNFNSPEAIRFRLNMTGKPASTQRISISAVNQPLDGIQLALEPVNGSAVMPYEKGTASHKDVQIRAYKAGRPFPDFVTNNAAKIKWYIGAPDAAYEITASSGDTYITAAKDVLKVHPDEVEGSAAIFAQIDGLWATTTLYDVSDSKKRWVLYAGYKTKPESEADIVQPLTIAGKYGTHKINYEVNLDWGYKHTATAGGVPDALGYTYTGGKLLAARRFGSFYDTANNQGTEIGYWVTDDISKLVTASWKDDLYWTCEGVEVAKGEVQWGPWFRIRGEHGTPGKTLVHVRMFKKVTANADGTIPTPGWVSNTASIYDQYHTGGWRWDPPVTGINEYVFEISRMYEYPDQSKNSKHESSYVTLAGTTWMPPVRFTGVRGNDGDSTDGVNGGDARMIFKRAPKGSTPSSLLSTNQAKSASMIAGEGWSYTPAPPVAGNPIFVASGVVRDGVMVVNWSVHPNPWSIHEEDLKGEGIKSKLAVSGGSNGNGWARIARIFRPAQYNWASFTLGLIGRQGHKHATLYYQAERGSASLFTQIRNIVSHTGSFGGRVKVVTVDVDNLEIWIQSDSQWHSIFYSVHNNSEAGVTLYSNNDGFTLTEPTGRDFYEIDLKGEPGINGTSHQVFRQSTTPTGARSGAIWIKI